MAGVEWARQEQKIREVRGAGPQRVLLAFTH